MMHEFDDKKAERLSGWDILTGAGAALIFLWTAAQMIAAWL